jgi:SAM-dependent methyltransferase
MDRVAADGFARNADAYERARPGWPEEAVRAAFAHWGLIPTDAEVLDLAAGTGRLTAVLRALGADVVAVEPVAEMRAFIREAPALEGTAERIPLPDASCDAVFVAEAFHWFDPPAALAEIARVLRPRGGLAIMWNTLLPSEGKQPWRTELRDLLAEVHYHPKGLPMPDASYDPRELIDWQRGGGWEHFEPLTHRSVEHARRVSRDQCVDRVASASFVGALPVERREELLARVGALLDRHGVNELEERWSCNAYLTRARVDQPS